VTEKELRRLQLAGADRLPDLVAWCWDRSDNTGDARFCGLARTFQHVSERWDVKGGLPTLAVQKVNLLLRDHMSAILDASDPADGAALARWMRHEIHRALDEGDAWL
jgi:hypothetical protein